ncbi:protein of unknown function [Agrobacterium pusense]|uniref:Uncharacterized protein n=1 Tax=Agrobacterium pusense TaxID=648995 RepID=U4Q3Y0_9HYPH|nr:protein of unknown function [Agrobacterium pusense]
MASDRILLAVSSEIRLFRHDPFRTALTVDADAPDNIDKSYIVAFLELMPVIVISPTDSNY